MSWPVGVRARWLPSGWRCLPNLHVADASVGGMMRLFVLALAFGLFGCESTLPPVCPGCTDPVVDSGPVDVGDSGNVIDGSVTSPDGGVVVEDGGSDGGIHDAGWDAGPADSGPVDSGVVDSGPVDSGPVDAGVVCAVATVGRRSTSLRFPGRWQQKSRCGFSWPSCARPVAWRQGGERAARASTNAAFTLPRKQSLSRDPRRG